MSISISPAITTTPALDSLFPIYWDDLPEGEIEEGVEVRTYETTLHTGYPLTNGTEYTISATPTSEWRGMHDETEGGIGETVTFTAKVLDGRLNVYGFFADSVPVKVIDVNIYITE